MEKVLMNPWVLRGEGSGRWAGTGRGHGLFRTVPASSVVKWPCCSLVTWVGWWAEPLDDKPLILWKHFLIFAFFITL